jgi:hypothetical protein
MTQPNVTLTRTDCEDLARGACVLGVGGGGLPALGLELLYEDLTVGRALNLIQVADIADDAMTCCAWGMGSIAPKDAVERERQLTDLGVPPDRTARHMARAIRELEAVTGKKVDVLVPFEPGGRVMPSVLSAASELGIAMSDGDYSGRAVPELNQIIPSIAGHSPCPAVAADQYGNVSCLLNSVSNPMAERIGKHLAMAAFGSVAMAGFLLTGRAARELIVAGTVSRAISVGRAIREARKSSHDPVVAAARAVDGEIVFSGQLCRRDWADDNGYMYGTMFLRDRAGKEMSIWFKNENHIANLDGTTIATSPDLISVVDGDTGEPYTNAHPEMKDGRHLAVIVSSAPERLTKADALKFHSPRWYGHDIEYAPFEFKKVSQ